MGVRKNSMIKVKVEMVSGRQPLYAWDGTSHYKNELSVQANNIANIHTRTDYHAF